MKYRDNYLLNSVFPKKSRQTNKRNTGATTHNFALLLLKKTTASHPDIMRHCPCLFIIPMPPALYREKDFVSGE